MPTYKGKYSPDCDDSSPDKIRFVDPGPLDMTTVKNIPERWLEANSDFSRKIIPTAGVKQNSGRRDQIPQVEERFVSDTSMPKGQSRRKTFKWQ